MLNTIWVFFFLSAFVLALFKQVVLGEADVFAVIMAALFSQAKVAFEISLGLTGVLSLWLGIMRIGEKSGFIVLLTRALTPLFSRLMPEIPKDHPAIGAIVMNISANALGLDNAATPLGIKAMQELQKLNTTPSVASNAQILFLVINTSSVTLFPISILQRFQVVSVRLGWSSIALAIEIKQLKLFYSSLGHHQQRLKTL